MVFENRDRTRGKWCRGHGGTAVVGNDAQSKANLGKYLEWQSLLDNYSTFAYYLSSNRG